MADGEHTLQTAVVSALAFGIALSLFGVVGYGGRYGTVSSTPMPLDTALSFGAAGAVVAFVYLYVDWAGW
ncbi:hypothetical protein [Haloarchaeobius sp. DYHT-AS-18]|uniref:hypothetical protein n=1 Tax=Haloarchaeobius sp. DYHT-AS-18 TaxID=3446117 RepID=UPI003EBBD17C